MKSKGSPYKLLSDSPYVKSKDPLGYDLIADKLKKLILSSKSSTPLTVGIQGGWGVGKSTLLWKLGEQLRKTEVKTMEFNAWLYEGGDITEGLVKSILNYFDDENLIRKTFRRKKAMATLRLGLVLAAGYFGIGRAVDQAWQAFTEDTEMNNQFRDMFKKVMERWTAKCRQRGLKELLVVFIDDLDRCSSERIMRVLQAIKLYLSVDNIVFVIGYDRDPIVAQIQPLIGKPELVTGNQYLEKIVQIPFTIPPPSDKELLKYLGQCLRESQAASQFDGLEEIIIKGNEGNPRKIKLFINTFIVRDSICRPEEKMDPVYLSRILLMELYFPRFYRWHLRKDPKRIQMLDDFVNISDAIRDDKGFSELSPGIQEALKRNERDEVSFNEGDHAEELRRKITEVFPEDFESFAQNRELVTLVKSLASELAKTVGEEREEVFKKVSKFFEWADIPQQQIVREAFTTKVAGITPRILWVDDHPENNGWIRETMIPYPITNVIVTSTDQAIKKLKEAHFDLVVSDIARGDDYHAGFDLARKIRDELQKPTKIIFYTGRVTSRRRAEAQELAAGITSDPYELVDMLISELGSATK